MLILSAERAPNKVHHSRASNSAGYIGLKYERSVIKMLKSILPQTMELENNVWFYYKTETEKSACSTDVIIFDKEFGFIIVVEIKFTWTPAAIQKLKELYCPVVTKVFNLPTKPLVIVKNLIPGCPLPKFSISGALLSDNPLVQWIGTGTLRL